MPRKQVAGRDIVDGAGSTGLIHRCRALAVDGSPKRRPATAAPGQLKTELSLASLEIEANNDENTGRQSMIAGKQDVATGLPLAGIKVVEIAQNLAGPYAGEILATLGADVIKIERPEGGDDARGWGPPFLNGTSTLFQTINRNKRGITLDLKDPEGLAWLKNHLASADVLVQNLRPGTMDALGLDAAALRALNPRLVYCSLWAYGHKGPMHLHPGYEPMMQAFSGIFSVNGGPEVQGSRVGLSILDLGTGLWTALGCIAALLRREKTGEGGVVDTSLFETALAWLSVNFASFQVTGKQPERHRSGSSRLVIFQAFDTSDGEVVVAAANDRLFAKLARELGYPQWASDPRYASNAKRVENREELVGLVAQIMRRAPTSEWIERLEAIGVPCAPINDLAQAREQPQTEAIGIFQQLPGIDMRVVGLPISLDGVRPPMRHRAPLLGEHNGEVGVPAAQGPGKTGD
jgi:crotonobetainyl-CoA:carnitine CoA-transferase CaiB-like acyl-CoA transferase